MGSAATDPADRAAVHQHGGAAWEDRRERGHGDGAAGTTPLR